MIIILYVVVPIGRIVITLNSSRYEFFMSELFDDAKHIKTLENINERVIEYKTDIYGFEDELDTLYHALGRYKKHNVILVGKAGVGKTSLIEKFCQEINKGNVPNKYKNKKIYELSLNSLLSGSRYRGEFEEKVRNLLENVCDNEDIILFVDEIHNMMNLGASQDGGAMTFDETLKPYLARNRITLIGATTEKEYRKYIKHDDAFNRRFSIIYVKEPNLKTTYEILKSYKKEYEDYYGIFLRDNELIKILIKSIKRRGNNPDKALDELEEFCYERSKDND